VPFDDDSAADLFLPSVVVAAKREGTIHG